MSFHTVYRDTSSIVGNHADDRDAAVRQAVSIAIADPELSLLVGVVELDGDGRRVGRFASASDLLEAADPVAVAVADNAPFPPPIGMQRESGWAPGVDPESDDLAPEAPTRQSALTSRQLDVLKLATDGHTQTEIATRLGIGLATVAADLAAALETITQHERAGATGSVREQQPERRS